MQKTKSLTFPERENILADTIYLLHPHSGLQAREQSGVLRGIVGAIMAYGFDFEESVAYISQLAIKVGNKIDGEPIKIEPYFTPEPWQDEFAKWY